MPCRRSMIPGSRMQLWTFLADRTYQRDIKPVPTLSCGGVFRYRSGERLHGMQEVTGSIPVFSTRLKTLHRNVWCLFCFAATRIACCFVFTSTCKNAFPGAAARLPCPTAKTPGRPIPNQPPGVVLCQKSPACTFTAGCRTGRSSPASTGWKAGSSPHTVRWSGPHRGRTAGPWR